MGIIAFARYQHNITRIQKLARKNRPRCELAFRQSKIISTGPITARLNRSTNFSPSAKEGEGHIDDAKFKIIVTSDGSVYWFMYKILHSYCLIDISEFPFDTQKCKIMIGSWSYDESTLDLRIFAEDKGMDLSLYEKNVVWELKSTHAERHVERYSCCPWTYVNLTYTLEFRRIPLYYLMTLVYPTMLLSFLSCVSFLFPADSGERVSLVISVLLGLIVFMLIVNDRTPVTSKETPLITKYFNSIAGVTILGLMFTAFILRLNHAHVGISRPVPGYLAKIRDCLATALWMRRNTPKRPGDVNAHDFVLSNTAAVKMMNNQEAVDLNPLRKLLTEEKVLKELEKITAHIEEESASSDIKEDWHYTMKVFDRFSFVFFFLIFLAVTTFFFASY